jgi:hypothetical protein
MTIQEMSQLCEAEAAKRVSAVKEQYPNCEGVVAMASSVTYLSIPSNFTATAININQINLAWNSVPNAVGYKLERCIGDGSWSEITSTSGTSYQNTGIDENVTYSYRVRAYNGSCYSQYSNTVSAHTPSTPWTFDNDSCWIDQWYGLPSSHFSSQAINYPSCCKRCDTYAVLTSGNTVPAGTQVGAYDMPITLNVVPGFEWLAYYQCGAMTFSRTVNGVPQWWGTNGYMSFGFNVGDSSYSTTWTSYGTLPM